MPDTTWLASLALAHRRHRMTTVIDALSPVGACSHIVLRLMVRQFEAQAEKVPGSFC